MICLIIKTHKMNKKYKKIQPKKLSKKQAKKISKRVKQKRNKRYQKYDYVDKKSAYIQACWDEVEKEIGMKK